MTQWKGKKIDHNEDNKIISSSLQHKNASSFSLAECQSFQCFLLNELLMTLYRVYRKHDFHKAFFIQQNKLKIKRSL